MLRIHESFKSLKMDGLPDAEKRRRVYAIAEKIADYAAGGIAPSGSNQHAAIMVNPIDHGGWTQAWRYLREPLIRSCHARDVELIYPSAPLNQSAEYDQYNEYRPIMMKAKKIDRGLRKRVGGILMLDSSASHDDVSNTNGPSVMGGVVWALENLRYFGDDGKGVKVSSALMRDYCPRGVANFACYETSEAWDGPKRTLRRMKAAFERLGGYDEGSPVHALSGFHTSPEQADINLPEARIHLRELGLDGIFSGPLELEGDVYPI